MSCHLIFLFFRGNSGKQHPRIYVLIFTLGLATKEKLMRKKLAQLELFYNYEFSIHYYVFLAKNDLMKVLCLSVLRQKKA